MMSMEKKMEHKKKDEGFPRWKRFVAHDWLSEGDSPTNNKAKTEWMDDQTVWRLPSAHPQMWRDILECLRWWGDVWGPNTYSGISLQQLIKHTFKNTSKSDYVYVPDPQICPRHWIGFSSLLLITDFILSKKLRDLRNTKTWMPISPWYLRMANEFSISAVRGQIGLIFPPSIEP